MANQLYPKGKEGFLGADIDLDSGNIKAILSETAYNSAHQFLSDVTARETSANLTTKTIVNGVFDSDDIVYPTVAVGSAISYVILYQDSGVAGTSRLVAHIDTATGLPVTPDGTNITVEVNVAGWFTL